MKILVAADDPASARELQRVLQARKHEVILVTDGAGVTEALQDGIDACVLDLVDGVAVLERVRAAGIGTPILRLGPSDVDAGPVASRDDEYVAKSTHVSEVLARLDALMHRQVRRTRLGDLQLDLASRRARVGARELPLSETQFALLAFFVQHAGETVTRPSVLKSVFGYDFDPGTNIVDVHVAHLRSKLIEPLRITTVRGTGYRLETI